MSASPVDRLHALARRPVPVEARRAHLGRIDAAASTPNARRWRPVAAIVALVATLGAGSTSLAIAGALPGPAQRVAHDVLDRLSIDVRDTATGCDDDPRPAARCAAADQTPTFPSVEGHPSHHRSHRATPVPPVEPQPQGSSGREDVAVGGPGGQPDTSKAPVAPSTSTATADTSPAPATPTTDAAPSTAPSTQHEPTTPTDSTTTTTHDTQTDETADTTEHPSSQAQDAGPADDGDGPGDTGPHRDHEADDPAQDRDDRGDGAQDEPAPGGGQGTGDDRGPHKAGPPRGGR